MKYEKLPDHIIDELSLEYPHIRALSSVYKLLPMLPKGRSEAKLSGSDLLNVADKIEGNFEPFYGYIIFREKGETNLQTMPVQILVNRKTGKVHEFSKKLHWNNFSFVTYVGMRINKPSPVSWLQNYQYLLENSPLALVVDVPRIRTKHGRN